MRILPDDTIALVIDYQEKILPPIFDKEEFLKRSNILLAGLKELGIPTIVTAQYTKGLGNTTPEILEALGHDRFHEKFTFSGLGNEEVVEELAKSGRKNVIICGIESHVCVLQTLIDIKEAGYQPILVEDCVSSRKENDKKAAIERAKYEGAIITTYEAILFELLQSAKSEHFKAISKLVK
ncbi:hydrolase [Anaerosacchariphilus polymeriproducens]|uniref:Hydrolase n=1 Tax=Anaerosacchariphilus polymeriproducens TaxID=1812858 RepID=A0A371AXJ7_9FIRM|nr:hydrolase [Anaerosacchariphilus polymeriproducens]RDU24306.1 hydrolase [Anaerosacchariphilus polymeriproducens]